MIHVEADYPFTHVAPHPDAPDSGPADARRWAFSRYQQGIGYTVWTAVEGGPVVRMIDDGGAVWPPATSVPLTVTVDAADLAAVMGDWHEAGPDRYAAILRVINTTGVEPKGWRL